MNTNQAGVPQTSDLNNPNVQVNNQNVPPSAVLNAGAQEVASGAVALPVTETVPAVIAQPEQISVIEPVIASEQVSPVETPSDADLVASPMPQELPAPGVEQIAPIAPPPPPIMEIPVVAPVVDKKTQAHQAYAEINENPRTLAEMAEFAQQMDQLANQDLL